MPWRAVTAMSQRYEFAYRPVSRDATLANICRKIGISRDIGYKWLRRYRESGLEGAGPQSSPAPLSRSFIVGA